MPNRLQQFCQRLLTKAELAWHRIVRCIANRRLQRLYGDLPHKVLPAPSTLETQTHRLAGIVRHHCSRGSEILVAHGGATMKLDAAEYAFSAMLEELRGTMKTLPSTWTPERMAPAILIDQSATGQSAQAAA